MTEQRHQTISERVEANELVTAYVDSPHTTMSAVSEASDGELQSVFEASERASGALFDVGHSPRTVCEVLAFARAFSGNEDIGFADIDWEVGGVFAGDDTVAVVFDADTLARESAIDTQRFTGVPLDLIQRPYDWVQFLSEESRGAVSHDLLAVVESVSGGALREVSAARDSVRLLERSSESPVLIQPEGFETMIVLAPVTLG
jgi:hypothetical protein